MVNLPCRRLAIGKARLAGVEQRTFGGLPIRDTADCQSALRASPFSRSGGSQVGFALQKKGLLGALQKKYFSGQQKGCFFCRF